SADADLVAWYDAEVVRECCADGHAAARCVEAAADQALFEVQNFEGGLQLDAAQHDGLLGVTADGKTGSGDDGRGGNDARHLARALQDGGPLVDGAQTL